MPDSTEGHASEAPNEQLPHRELRDPTVLRAISHPVRLRLFEELLVRGPATATQLSARLGESPANLSWHLRQLAHYGFVEEAGGGTGRQRPWKVVPRTTSLADPTADDEPEYATAVTTALEVLQGREIEAWRAWQASRLSEPREWVDASVSTNYQGIWLTLEELAAFRQEFVQLVDRHLRRCVDRIEPGNRPEGSRPVRFVAWAFPYGPTHSP